MNPYAGYAYSYPHKTAYRELDPPVPLAEAWRDEPRDALFLYLHVPYCEMRCGFCNLFALAAPGTEEVGAWLEALRRQARRVRAALGEAAFARMAVGGGTPTYLGPAGLESLFDVAGTIMGASGIPSSVETSPGTADAATLAVLRARGVTRISIGVQSFDDRELAALGRGERAARAQAALERIRAAGFPVLNLDLIYGIAGQTAGSWLASLRAALAFAPEEIYLYPLYVRPLTALSRRARGGDLRLELYREGRALLLDAGFQQLSMRMFRRQSAPPEEGPVYCCQDDGLVGLGCGARSYTRRLHYASRFAVSRAGVRELIADYAARSDAEFEVADWGAWLDADEERRRWVIKSLLRAEGLPEAGYSARFGGDLYQHLPLSELIARGLARREDGRLRLTPEGLEQSDAIGPWLYSPAVSARMAAAVPG